MKIQTTEGREGNRDICEQVLIALRGIIRAIDMRSRSLDRQCGLTGPQLVVLKAIAAAGEITVGELARQVNLSGATVTGVLDRLEQRGYALRTRSDEDKRRVLVEAAPKAAAVLAQAPSLLTDEFVEDFLRLADWEQALILSSLQRVAAMMKVQQIDSQPVLEESPLDRAAREAVDAMPAGAGARRHDARPVRS